MVYRIINAWSMGQGQKICPANLGTSFSDQLNPPSSPSGKKTRRGQGTLFWCLTPVVGRSSRRLEVLDRRIASVESFPQSCLLLSQTVGDHQLLVVAHPSRQPVLPSARHAPQP